MPDATPMPTPTPAPTLASSSTFLLGSLCGLVAAVLLTGAGLGVWWWVKTAPIPGPDIVVPAAVQAQPGRIVEIDIQTRAADLQWDSKNDPGEWDLITIEAGRKNFFVAPTSGVYNLQVRGVLAGKIAGPFSCVVTVGKPVPPVPPVPPIPPTPPQPPAPIPGDGLRVLMIYDAEALGKLPAGQREVLYSETLRGWLREHTAKGPDGKSPEWRALPANEDMSAESKTWQDAMKRDRKLLPWLIISNGKTGYEGPLPASMDETMKLLQKYAGG